MDFDTWIDQAWTEHAADAAAVAQRLPEGAALAADPKQLARLAHLTLHLHGEHLAQWDAGRAALQALQRHPQHQGDAVPALALVLAGLDLAAGRPAAAEALDRGARIRATAIAAAALTDHDTARALALFTQASELAEAAELPAGDPAARALAVAANNLACTLENKPSRSEQERELMLAAAQAARRWWALAGTWLETERAEYRLSCTWRHAGDPARARQHAQRCLEIVQANGGAALERFFGWEALGRAEAAAGDAAAFAHALQQAREAFAALDASDRTWCTAELEQLAAALP